MLKFPNDSQRHVIVGMTGSGKTQFGVDSLSKRSYTEKPWFIFNFKDDELIGEIPHAEHIDVSEFPKGKSSEKGIFIVNTVPGDFDGIDSFLMKVWEKRNMGVFIDEMYMVSKIGSFSQPLRLLLTQGRSRQTPLILLSQRPAWIDMFSFSEATFIQTFKLTTAKDWARVHEFIRVPDGAALNLDGLPEYYSYYYNANAPATDPEKLVIMRPAADRQTILDRFDRRLRPESEQTKEFSFPAFFRKIFAAK